MNLSDLRQAAIESLEESPVQAAQDYRQSAQELIYELRVQQVELEMQNEELRRAQFELEESRDKFANLFDFAPVGYVTLDPSNRIVEANLTFAKLLHLERGAVLGQALSKYVVTEDMPRLHRHLDEISSAGRKTSCELTLKKNGGKLLQVRLDSISANDGNRYISLADQSENADLIRAKEDSDERLKGICHSLPIPIAFIDRAEAYRFNNAAHERWFGHSRESINGRRVQEVFGDQIHALMLPNIKRALAGQACTCRLEIPFGDGGLRLVELQFAPIRDEKNGVVGYYEMIFDVSAASQAEEERARRADLEFQLNVLSGRQRTIFRSLINGKANKTISFEMELGVRTIERERHSILRLLEVESIRELLVKFAGFAGSDDARDPPP